MEPTFQKEFLRDLVRGKQAPGLAVFGKHPAWDDHMDDLGLATSSLRMCKRLLYIQGIAANAARQHSLGEGQLGNLLPYRHSLLWVRDREMILLRLVESEDGRGRAFFPLVGAIHFSTSCPEEALAASLTPLRNFVDACRALHSRDEVRELHRNSQTRFESDIPGLGTGGSSPEPPTREELEAMRAAASGKSFVRARIPVTRYDLAKSLGALLAAAPEHPVLLAHGDAAPEITVCLGQPDRGEFWFLRDNQAV